MRNVLMKDNHFHFPKLICLCEQYVFLIDQAHNPKFVEHNILNITRVLVVLPQIVTFLDWFHFYVSIFDHENLWTKLWKVWVTEAEKEKYLNINWEYCFCLKPIETQGNILYCKYESSKISKHIASLEMLIFFG